MKCFNTLKFLALQIRKFKCSTPWHFTFFKSSLSKQVIEWAVLNANSYTLNLQMYT